MLRVIRNVDVSWWYQTIIFTAYDFFVCFWYGEKMAKSFIDAVQDSFRMGLGILVKTKKTPSLEPIHNPRNSLSALNFAGSWSQLKVAYDSSVIRSPGTPIRGLDKHPYLFRLEHARDHRVRSEFCADCSIESFPFRAPPGTDKECVLWIFHKGSAVATRLIVSFLEAFQVRI